MNRHALASAVVIAVATAVLACQTTAQDPGEDPSATPAASRPQPSTQTPGGPTEGKVNKSKSAKTKTTKKKVPPMQEQLSPPWLAASKVAEAHLGLPLDSCHPIAPEGQRVPFLLEVTAGNKRRRILVHEGQVIDDTGKPALNAYLQSIKFPQKQIHKALLLRLLVRFEVIPEPWRFGPLAPAHWKNPTKWWRRESGVREAGKEIATLATTKSGAEFIVHRLLPPEGNQGAYRKGTLQRLRVGFDATGHIQHVIQEEKKGNTWKIAK